MASNRVAYTLTDLLGRLIAQRGDAIHLHEGEPPVFEIKRVLCKVEGSSLERGDTYALLAITASEGDLVEFQKNGLVCFYHRFGSRPFFNSWHFERTNTSGSKYGNSDETLANRPPDHFCPHPIRRCHVCNTQGIVLLVAFRAGNCDELPRRLLIIQEWTVPVIGNTGGEGHHRGSAKAPASRTHSKRFATYHIRVNRFAKRLECVRLAGAFARYVTRGSD